MKIGWDAKRAFWNNTGLGNYSRTIIQSIVTLYPNNDYLLFAPKTKGSQYESVFRDLKIVKNNTSWPNSFWRSFTLTSAINEHKIDIYHGLSNELPFTIGQSKAKKIVTIHDLIFLRYPKLYKPIDIFIYKKKFLFACQQADVVIAVSEQTKQDIIHFLSIPTDKIEVIYQSAAPIFDAMYASADLDLAKKTYGLPEKFILNVGTIESRKNAMLLIDALPLLPDDIHLVVVGKTTAYFDLLVQRIEALGVQSRVLFLHNVSYNMLPKIYQLAAVFCYPSRFEGFGIPIIEALKMQVPVVACTGSCLEEAGGPDSLYVHPDDFEGCAFAIQSILDNSDKRTDMIAKGYEYVKQFDSKLIAEKTFKIYQRLLQK